MTNMTPASCIVCGGSRWTPLPDPGNQSMASDWRVVPEPLARSACDTCGLARRRSTSQDSLFETGYALYSHAPGGVRESARQEQYARWIVDEVGRSPVRVLDVGCGNGSLLLALGKHWPDAVLQGCDPSAESVAHGSGPGLRLWQGTAGDLPVTAASDLVVSINVIEHTADPAAFAHALRDVLTPDGRLVVVCPDGGRPGLELMFADHLFSFAPPHLEMLLAREKLGVISHSVAPSSLGDFQMVVAKRSEEPALPRVFPASALAERRAYLEAWRALDERLQARVPASVVCFGAGEAAGLLRAYAPRTWQRVTACAIDQPSGGTFGSLPVVDAGSVRSDQTILLGVRPSDQPMLATRLRTQFANVVAWYDLLDGAREFGHRSDEDVRHR